ncbi:hypothetical protein BGZ60DRAFT_566238 [Tricladium varicosporioides]|nr:hypothetical protein BGZ60DRAFT_566238 [Hymenoscyphus varicosporioides]
MKVQQGPSSSATGSSPTPIDGVFSNLSPPSSGTTTPKTLVDDDGFSLIECNREQISDTDNCASSQDHGGIRDAIERAQFVGGDSLYNDHGDPSPPYGGTEDDEEAELRALQFEMAYNGLPPPAPLGKGWTQHPPKSYVEDGKHYQVCGDSYSDNEPVQDQRQLNPGLRGTKGAGKEFQSQSSGNWGEGIQQGEYRCALLPTRKAVWVHMPSKLKLSTLAATILLKELIIQVPDLEVYHPEEAGARDPISGIIAATHSTVGGVVMGVADYPIEITKMVKANKDVAPTLAKEFALDSGKGISRIVGTGLKAPMDFTMGISKGFNNMPKLYQDDTVREPEKVTGIVSGLSAAGKGFGYGLFDGVTGLVTQPVKGAQNGGGVGGFLKGFGKGIGGVVCKPAAGAVGLPAYAFKGVYEQVRKIGKPDTELKEISDLLSQGEEEWKATADQERNNILVAWFEEERTRQRAAIMKKRITKVE